jgi:hypothetical protein
VRIQVRYSLAVGRKSREKRQRRTGEQAMSDVVSADSTAEFSVAIASPRRRPMRPGHVGARVARVAVDDETWAAFRQVCGDTPASIRLGQLVEADVQRARETTAESEAVAAVRAIRAHADQLEAFVRDVR